MSARISGKASVTMGSMNSSDEEGAAPAPGPTSHRRPGNARLSDPPGGTTFRRRLSENHRSALLAGSVLCVYVALTASALRDGAFVLAFGCFVLAVALAVSFLTWLTPHTANRRWFAWLWVPLLFAPFAWLYIH